MDEKFDFENETYEEILKKSLHNCGGFDEKINRLAGIICKQIHLIDAIVHSLDPEIQKNIFDEIGYPVTLN